MLITNTHVSRIYSHHKEFKRIYYHLRCVTYSTHSTLQGYILPLLRHLVLNYHQRTRARFPTWLRSGFFEKYPLNRCSFCTLSLLSISNNLSATQQENGDQHSIFRPSKDCHRTFSDIGDAVTSINNSDPSWLIGGGLERLAIVFRKRSAVDARRWGRAARLFPLPACQL